MGVYVKRNTRPDCKYTCANAVSRDSATGLQRPGGCDLTSLLRHSYRIVRNGKRQCIYSASSTRTSAARSPLTLHCYNTSCHSRIAWRFEYSMLNSVRPAHGYPTDTRSYWSRVDRVATANYSVANTEVRAGTRLYVEVAQQRNTLFIYCARSRTQRSRRWSGARGLVPRVSSARLVA